MRPFVFLLILPLVVNGCAGDADMTTQDAAPTESMRGTTVTGIGPGQLKDMLDSYSRVFLLDTHIPEQKRIPGTDTFIPYNELASNMEKLPADKDTPIVVYCRSGSMSEQASQELARMGYTEVYDLLGGTNGWKLTGYPVE